MCISRLCELLVKLDLQAIATAQEPALTVSVSALPRQDQGWSVRDVCKCTQLQTSMISPAAPGHCRCCWSISTALHRGSVGRRHQLAHAACSSCCSISGHLSVQRLRCSKWTTRHKRCKCTVAAHEQDRDVDKEASRKYRRTEFTFERWAAHRSTKRYRRHIISLAGSRIVRGLLAPLVTLTTIASAVAAYEILRELHVLPSGLPDISFELTAPFSSTSFALSLLLVFRTNTSYARWQEARHIWAGITRSTRDMVRQTVIQHGRVIPSNDDNVITLRLSGARDDTTLVDVYKRWSIAFSTSLKCHLREDEDLSAELQGILQPDEIKVLMAAKNRPNYTLQVLSELMKRSHIEAPEKFRMDQNLTSLHDALGACERILRTPIPLSYTRHTSRFLVIWLALMPFTLWKSCHLAMVPASGVIAFLLLGIEEIGVQIEEPFSILPLESICETIQTDLHEMTDIAAEIRELVEPYVQAISGPGSEHHHANGSEQQFLRAGDDADSFGTPSYTSDHR